MRKRPLGKTGLEVSELCLGTWGLCGDAYGAVEESQQDAVIERAVALGITAFETADCYARGTMETRLGRLVPTQGDFVIVTKIGTNRETMPRKKDFSPTFLKQSIEKSQTRLARPLDVVLLHNPSLRAFEKKETCATLQELKEKGTLKAWGASVGTVQSAEAAIAQGAQVVELVYNAFSSKDLQEISEQIREKGVAVLGRSVLAHGLLCGGWSRFKTFQNGDHRRERWTVDQFKKRIDQVSALRTLMGDDIQSTRAGALRFALCNEQLSCAVIGPRSTMQLDQLVREAGEGPPYIPTDRLRRLEVQLAEVGITAVEPTKPKPPSSPADPAASTNPEAGTAPSGAVQ
ncbi:MAG TPA: aldo/keto reductase [Polyangiaceae bacterium]|nr:aldo/keto reductase [Polyangiaceae bacterium]